LTLASATYCLPLCSATLLGRLVPRDDDLSVAFVHAGIKLHGGEIHARPEPAPAATTGPEPTAAAAVVATTTAAAAG
jgi:hypothetical protein